MTLCNGYCSGGRAIPGKRTPAGKIDPFARRERRYCAVSASLAARSMTKLSSGYTRCPSRDWELSR